MRVEQVEVSCTARVPSSDGRQGEGPPYFATPADRPLRFTIGDGQVGLTHTPCNFLCVLGADQ